MESTMEKDRIFNEAREKAKEHGIEFKIKIEEMPELPEYCPVLGIKINESEVDRRATLDRIDQELEYVLGNVKVISARASRLRSDGTAEEFQRIINYMRGISNKKNKLLDEEVLEIRRLLKKGMSQRKLAHKYNVSQAVIGKINREEIWKNIISE